MSADHPVNPAAYESRDLRRRIRHHEDENLFQLGLHDAGRLAHGIKNTFDQVAAHRLPLYQSPMSNLVLFMGVPDLLFKWRMVDFL